MHSLLNVLKVVSSKTIVPLKRRWKLHNIVNDSCTIHTRILKWCGKCPPPPPLTRVVSISPKIFCNFLESSCTSPWHRSHYRPLAVTSQLQLLSAMLEGKVKVWNTEMSTNVKRATRKGLLPDYYSILAIIFNIIHVFFSETFLFFFVFPSTRRPNTQFVMCDVTRK